MGVVGLSSEVVIRYGDKVSIGQRDGGTDYTTFYTTFALYAGGELTKDETISRLRIKRLYNQLV